MAGLGSQMAGAMAGATVNAAAVQAEMRNLMRDKTPEQKKMIRFFYQGKGGCVHKSMTPEEYDQEAHNFMNSINGKAKALNKLGIDEEEVKEIKPVTFTGYEFNEKSDNLVQNGVDGNLLSSDVQLTWLFFGDKEIFVYQYTHNMLNGNDAERTIQYFYKDVTNFSTNTESYEKTIVSQSGCLHRKSYVKSNITTNKFSIIVPGDSFSCSISSHPEDMDETIRGMRNKLREKKDI